MPDEFIGKKFGGYEILSLIGRGGMATVYRAQQISMNRVVALKLLPRHFAKDETYLQRFTREVEIVAHLEHRAIVPVYDYGEEDEQPFIVMRYLAGGSVDDLLRGGPLTAERIVAIIDLVGPALDYAHSKQVLHRDLKPSNVLLDETGGAFLTDFGIARILGENSAPTLTTQGVVGTPSYMSPEQAQGKELDGRSDLYALGVMMFEMATGRRPFEADTPYSIAVMQVTTPPPTPRSVNPAIHPGLEAVILKAMSKPREDRYPTAAALVDALRAALNAPDSSFEGTVPVQALLDDTLARPAHAGVSSYSVPPAPVNPDPPVAAAPPPSAPIYPSPATPAPPSQVVRPPASGVYPRARPRRNEGSLWIPMLIGMLIGLVLLGIVFLVGGVLLNVIGLPGRIETTVLPFGVPTNTPAASPNALVPVALDGRIVYSSERAGNFDLYIRDLATGDETRLTQNPGVDVSPAASPDGQWIAFASDRDGDFDIWIVDSEGQTNSRRLTNNSVDDFTPAWSPDSQSIVFASDTDGDGATSLYQIPLEGGEAELVYANGQRNAQPRWIGEWLYFVRGLPLDASTWEIVRLRQGSDEPETMTANDVRDAWPAPALPIGIVYSTNGEGESSIVVMSTDGQEMRTLYDGPGFDWGGVVSDDGRWLAFASDEEGRDQIYLMPMDGTTPQRLTTGENGAFGVAWLPA